MEKSLIHTKFTDTLSPDYTTGSQSIKVSCLMFEKKKIKWSIIIRNNVKRILNNTSWWSTNLFTDLTINDSV